MRQPLEMRGKMQSIKEAMRKRKRFFNRVRLSKAL